MVRQLCDSYIKAQALQISRRIQIQFCTLQILQLEANHIVPLGLSFLNCKI